VSRKKIGKKIGKKQRPRFPPALRPKAEACGVICRRNSRL
jgi:hypothetical protein